MGLKQIAELSIDWSIMFRFYAPIKSAQLHHFCDASEKGYGTASYLRVTNGRSKVHIAFVMGKAWVAPMKQMTIPRMELTASTLAVKMERILITELQIPLERSVFWTDSTSVLKYI